MVWCCNELNAGYAADGYARKRGVGCLVVTFCVGGEGRGGDRGRTALTHRGDTGEHRQGHGRYTSGFRHTAPMPFVVCQDMTRTSWQLHQPYSPLAECGLRSAACCRPAAHRAASHVPGRSGRRRCGQHFVYQHACAQQPPRPAASAQRPNPRSAAAAAAAARADTGTAPASNSSRHVQGCSSSTHSSTPQAGQQLQRLHPHALARCAAGCAAQPPRLLEASRPSTIPYCSSRPR